MLEQSLCVQLLYASAGTQLGWPGLWQQVGRTEHLGTLASAHRSILPAHRRQAGRERSCTLCPNLSTLSIAVPMHMWAYKLLSCLSEPHTTSCPPLLCVLLSNSPKATMSFPKFAANSPLGSPAGSPAGTLTMGSPSPFGASGRLAPLRATSGASHTGNMGPSQFEQSHNVSPAMSPDGHKGLSSSLKPVAAGTASFIDSLVF